MCYVSGVNLEYAGITYGDLSEDATLVALNLKATVEGNCGDDVLYTLTLDDAPFDIAAEAGSEDMPHVKTVIPLGGNVESTELSFDGSLGHYVCINYEVNAHNALRKDKGSTVDHFETCITVADPIRCVVKAEIIEMSFGEQNEMLEAQYDLKCVVNECSHPTAEFTFSNLSAKTSDGFQRDLKPYELEDCIRDKARITVVVPNEPGCYAPAFKLMDK